MSGAASGNARSCVQSTSRFTVNFNKRPSGVENGTIIRIGGQFVSTPDVAATKCLATPNCIGFWMDGRYPVGLEYWINLYAAGPGTDLIVKYQVTTYVKK